MVGGARRRRERAGAGRRGRGRPRRAQRDRSRRPSLRRAGRHAGADRRGVRASPASPSRRSPAETTRVDPRLAGAGVAGDGGDDRAGERRRGRAASTSSAGDRRSRCSAGCAPAPASGRCSPGRPRRPSSATRSSRRRRTACSTDVAHGRRLVEQALAVDQVMPEPMLDWDALAGARLPTRRDRRLDRRRPHDQLGMEQHLLVDVGLVGVALGEQQLGGRAAEQLAGLAHRAERHRGRAGELDVVVADDGELAGDVDAHAGHLLQQPEGEQVVGAERRRRPPRPGQADEPLAGPPALGDVERRRSRRPRARRRGGRSRASGLAGCPAAGRRPARWSSDRRRRRSAGAPARTDG